MTDQFVETGQSPPAPGVSLAPVEMVLDNYRVIGDLKQPGVNRRLVDVMNNNDLEFFVIKDGEIDDPFTDLDVPKNVASLEIRRESILFAFPRGGLGHEPADSFESVRKVPVRSTIVLPGFEVNGDVHFIPDVRPEDVPMLQHRNFVAVTDARVRASGGRVAEWNEPLVVVNIGQALIFAIDRD